MFFCLELKLSVTNGKLLELCLLVLFNYQMALKNAVAFDAPKGQSLGSANSVVQRSDTCHPICKGKSYTRERELEMVKVNLE